MSDDRERRHAEDALLINALADGELDAASALALEKRLADEPELAKRYASVVALRRALREKIQPENAPAGLRDRITALAADAPRETAPRRQARAWPRLVIPTLAAAMALGVGLDRLWLSSSEPDPRIDSLVAAFRRGQIADQPVDVVASDRHVVKPWLARKLPVSTVVVDLAGEGFPLVGARIDIVAGQPAPTLVYRRREHQIALTELPSAALMKVRGALQGYASETWSDGDRSYVAVSDVSPAELAHFAELFRKVGAGERSGGKDTR
jgi:anti-sigma factor RsiW